MPYNEDEYDDDDFNIYRRPDDDDDPPPGGDPGGGPNRNRNQYRDNADMHPDTINVHFMPYEKPKD